MLANPNAPLATAWNTWSDRPGEMVFLPLGVRITPVLYSTKLGRATTLRPPSEIVFGPRTLDGAAVAFEARHGGTHLAFTYGTTDPYGVTGSWTACARGEWGQRFWVVLCLSAESGADVKYDVDAGVAIVTVEGRSVALEARVAPLMVTGHDSVAALSADLEQHGYFDRRSRAVSAKVIALRFNLESMPATTFAAAVADTPVLAATQARAAQGIVPPRPAPSLHSGRHAGALDAVRDVIGWNTVFDAANARRYTAASRIWNLGTFAVWYNDQIFAALMAGLLDAGLGRDNMAVALAGATPQGNIACLLNSRDRWVDRTQAPHGAFMAYTMFLRSRDRSLLELAYEPLARNHRWWWQHRDPERIGLVSCGTSDVGDAMFKGTAFGARNETGMDNSATHDEAVYDPATRTLSTLDVGLNSAMALDAEMLAAIAHELGREAEAKSFATIADRTREKIRTELWDEARGLFANRQRRGGFVRSVAPTTFFPLLCGAATPTQAARLLDHLVDPAKFGGAFVLPNATRDDPAFADNVYWRGRIWPNVNYLVWQGLRRYGFEQAASDLARKSLDLFERSWRDDRLCGENYGADTGEVMDQADTDPFYTWGAMLPLTAVGSVMDVAPWRGWEVMNTGEPVRLGPLASPAGDVVVSVENGILTLAKGDRPIFSSDLRGRLSHILVEEGLVSVCLTDGCTVTGFFRLGPSFSGRLISARLDGVEVPTSLAEDCRTVELAGVAAGSRLDCHLNPWRP